MTFQKKLSMRVQTPLDVIRRIFRYAYICVLASFMGLAIGDTIVEFMMKPPDVGMVALNAILVIGFAQALRYDWTTPSKF